MGEIVNLNKYRKKQQLANKKRKASTNRVQFGRLKAERDVASAQNAKQSKELDIKKLEPIPFVRPEDRDAEDDSNESS